MPNEAIKTGCIDQVLPLADIPRAIQRLCAG
jgi:chemotaxis response regulator CheB